VLRVSSNRETQDRSPAPVKNKEFQIELAINNWQMKVWGLVQSFPADDLVDKMFGFEPKHRSFSFFSRRRRRRMREKAVSPLRLLA